MRGLIAGMGLFVIGLFVVFVILPFYFWIKHIIRLSKKEDKTNMWVCVVLGVFFSPLTGWIVGHFLGKDEEKSWDEEKRDSIF